MKRSLAIGAVALGALAFSTAPAGAAHGLGDQTIGMNGQKEVGTVGDKNGSGKIDLSFFDAVDNPTVVFPGEHYICAELTVRNVEGDTTGLHIHEGGKKSNGPVVVNLLADAVDGCVAVDEETFDDIVADPADYYVNYHTDVYPAGAIRGQLHSFS